MAALANACLRVQTMHVLAYCRILVLSGSTLNIMFNMFRVVGPPVWIPIKWNVGFLALNAVMVLLLMNEREEAEELGKDPEQVCTLPVHGNNAAPLRTHELKTRNRLSAMLLPPFMHEDPRTPHRS